VKFLSRYLNFFFQDDSILWVADNPRLTVCFMQTVLVWTPCAFLAVFSLLDLYYRSKSRYSDIPWSILNLPRLLLTIALISLSVTDLIFLLNAQSSNITSIYTVQITTTSIKIATFVSQTAKFYFFK
jgi:ATP-binding cassette, subfamily C (CFTR/MRP), member 1